MPCFSYYFYTSILVVKHVLLDDPHVTTGSFLALVGDNQPAICAPRQQVQSTSISDPLSTGSSKIRVSLSGKQLHGSCDASGEKAGL